MAAHTPELHVVSLERIRRHEETDPLRVEQLSRRIEAEQRQANPMVCSEAHGGELVLLDGATRTEALKSLGMEHAVVQLVDPTEVTLETWHHVVRRCPPERLMQALRERAELILVENEGPPLVRVVEEGGTHSVLGDKVSPYATLLALVDTYLGHWTVTRVTDPSADTVSWRFPDWTAVIEFPPLSIEDVMKAALGEDLLPAGVTRFLVPGRTLGLDIELSLLRYGTVEEKQDALEALLKFRGREGRIRRYDEPVIVLDD